MIVEPTKVEEDEDVGGDSSSFDEEGGGREMVLRLLPKIDYGALLGACRQVRDFCNKNASESGGGIRVPELPDELPPSLLQQPAAESDVSHGDGHDSLLRDLHRALFELHVVEGFLICPDTGRKFPVKDGIPNMILHEDEH